MEIKYICSECVDEPCILTENHDGFAPTHCVIAANRCQWKRVEQPQPVQQPEPELLTGYEAIARAAREGGEVYGKDGTFRVSFDANGNVLKESDTHGVTAHIGLYAVRPLPPETFDFTEAMVRLVRGEKVRDRHGNTLWPEIIATNDDRKLYKVDLSKYSPEDRFRAVVK